MNISQTYDHNAQRLEIKIVIDAYDLKVKKPEDIRTQLRQHLKDECAEVIHQMIKDSQEEAEKPTT